MAKRLALLFFICIGLQSVAQKTCSNEGYTKREISANLLLKNNLEEIEVFTRNKVASSNATQRTNHLPDIKIPVVFHVLYHTPDQNIPLSTIGHLIAALNRDFNKRNADTANIPDVFKPLAANMGFEFKLATMDPKGRITTGIVKKYTPITYWMSDDKMKFNESHGSDGWDSKSYLNIWICNMRDALGYGTLPGMDPKKDGVVLSFEDINVSAHSTTSGVNDFRTIVHEVGHWLNLYHVWGEGYCGDDRVEDTPKQSTYTPGCPNGPRHSCGNNQTGDMYMNFMDFTNDVCMNMFTNGQRKRARALFELNGARSSILRSKGLNISTVSGADLPDYYPQWLRVQVYPNPATSVVNLYFEYDERWIGRKMQILDISGKIVVTKIISSKIQQINVSHLNAGIYFIRAEKEEEKLHAKFVKL